MVQPRLKFKVHEETKATVTNLHPEIKRKLKGSFKIIADNPCAGKELKEDLQGLRGFKVSRFRIIYRIVSKFQVEIVAIGPRRVIYEETYKRIKGDRKTAFH